MSKSTVEVVIKVVQDELAGLQKSLEWAKQWAPTTTEARRLDPIILSVWNARAVADNAARKAIGYE